VGERHLKAMGHEVIVANPRRTRLIASPATSRTAGRGDAARFAAPSIRRCCSRSGIVGRRRRRILAMIGRAPRLGGSAYAVDQHGARTDEVVRERAAGMRRRIRRWRLAQDLPAALREAIEPLLEQAAEPSARIPAYDERIQQMARKQYPENRPADGGGRGGRLIALTFILTLEDHIGSREPGCGRLPGDEAAAAAERRRDPELESAKRGTCTCGSCWCRERM